MKEDAIAEIGIRESDLYIKPVSQKFPYIYRECMGVTWHPGDESLAMMENEDWDFLMCFRQIFSAVREQGCYLLIESDTNWKNVPDELKARILATSKSLLSESREHERWLKTNRDQLMQEGMRAEKRHEAAVAWEKAQTAFRNKDFAAFVSILSPHVDHLTSAQLQKFAYAQKKKS